MVALERINAKKKIMQNKYTTKASNGKLELQQRFSILLDKSDKELKKLSQSNGVQNAGSILLMRPDIIHAGPAAPTNGRKMLFALLRPKSDYSVPPDVTYGAGRHTCYIYQFFY